MHYAVDQLDLDTIFPVVQTTPNSIPSSPDVQKCLDVLKDSELNPFQLQAITSMLDASCLKVREGWGTVGQCNDGWCLPWQIPSLVLGPFGCGKTRALSECIQVLALHMPKSRVLVCTHSNSAADIYVENLDAQLSSKHFYIHHPMFYFLLLSSRVGQAATVPVSTLLHWQEIEHHLTNCQEILQVSFSGLRPRSIASLFVVCMC